MQPFDDRIDSWSAEFTDAPESSPFPGKVRGVAAEVARAFLRGACGQGCDPSQIGEREARAGMLDGVGPLALDAEARNHAPEVVAAFLQMLGRQGRIASAATLGAFVRALAPVAAQSGAARVAPIRREYSKLGVNDPCPCGSGKKWKKCCRLTLGG